jgi:hypothetical protein
MMARRLSGGLTRSQALKKPTVGRRLTSNHCPLHRVLPGPLNRALLARFERNSPSTPRFRAGQQNGSAESEGVQGSPVVVGLARSLPSNHAPSFVDVLWCVLVSLPTVQASKPTMTADATTMGRGSRLLRRPPCH